MGSLPGSKALASVSIGLFLIYWGEICLGSFPRSSALLRMAPGQRVGLLGGGIDTGNFDVPLGLTRGSVLRALSFTEVLAAFFNLTDFTSLFPSSLNIFLGFTGWRGGKVPPVAPEWRQRGLGGEKVAVFCLLLFVLAKPKPCFISSE